MESLGASQEEIDLRGVASLDEVARRVKARLDATPGDSWITGRNWDQSLWPGGAFPTAAVLDAVAPEAAGLARARGRPRRLGQLRGDAAGQGHEGREGPVRRPDHPRQGRASRPASSSTARWAWSAAPCPASTRLDVRRRLLAAQDLVLRAGLTGVHDAGISGARADVYRELDREGRLMIRVYGMASPPSGGEVEFVSRRPQAGPDGARFELRAIKLFIDGAMGSRGGLLFEPYHDDPGNSGLLLIDPKVLEATTTAALRHGWQVCTHAIGDKGNALVLDAYAAARKAVPEARDPRLRIEHAQVVRKEDVRRFAELGVIASMQPSHASDDMRWADARLGPGPRRRRLRLAMVRRRGRAAGLRQRLPRRDRQPVLGTLRGDHPAGRRGQTRRRLASRATPHARGSPPRLHRRLGVCRLRRGPPGHPQAGLPRRPDDRRPRPVPGHARELLAARVVMTIVDGAVVFEQTK